MKGNDHLCRDVLYIMNESTMFTLQKIGCEIFNNINVTLTFFYIF